MPPRCSGRGCNGVAGRRLMFLGLAERRFRAPGLIAPQALCSSRSGMAAGHREAACSGNDGGEGQRHARADRGDSGRRCHARHQPAATCIGSQDAAARRLDIHIDFAVGSPLLPIFDSSVLRMRRKGALYVRDVSGMLRSNRAVQSELVQCLGWTEWRRPRRRRAK